MPLLRCKTSHRGYTAGMRATWKPHEKHGTLTMQSDLPDSVFAFPKQRKEPLTDKKHTRNAVARFDQITDVSEADRALAFANIKKAALHYGIDLSESSWTELGVHPQPHRAESAKRGAATRKRTGAAKTAARKAAETRRKKATQRGNTSRTAQRRGNSKRRP